MSSLEKPPPGLPPGTGEGEEAPLKAESLPSASTSPKDAHAVEAWSTDEDKKDLHGDKQPLRRSRRSKRKPAVLRFDDGGGSSEAAGSLAAADGSGSAAGRAATALLAKKGAGSQAPPVRTVARPGKGYTLCSGCGLPTPTRKRRCPHCGVFRANAVSKATREDEVAATPAGAPPRLFIGSNGQALGFLAAPASTAGFPPLQQHASTQMARKRARYPAPGPAAPPKGMDCAMASHHGMPTALADSQSYAYPPPPYGPPGMWYPWAGGPMQHMMVYPGMPPPYGWGQPHDPAASSGPLPAQGRSPAAPFQHPMHPAMLAQYLPGVAGPPISASDSAPPPAPPALAALHQAAAAASQSR